LRRQRVLEICDKIERRNLTGLKIGLGNGIRADTVDKPLLKRMKDIGFSYVAFGVESASNKVLKVLRKGETIERIEEGVKAAIEVGLPVQLTFLPGSPTETEEEVKASIRFALKYPVIGRAFYNILPFPKTELYSKLLEECRFIRNPETHLNDSSHWVHSPVFETPELSKNDRIRLLKWANEVTKRHKDGIKEKHKIERMKSIGIPKIMGLFIVKVPKNEFIMKILRYFGILQRIKNFLKINF
jgi:radical SAM superfamily enzyme YgiQ (UPF0313 family)